MSEASQHPLGLALVGGSGIAAIGGAVLNSGVFGGLPLIVGVPVGFAFLGHALGKRAGKKAMPLALLSCFAGAVAAFVVQAGVIAVGVSRNPTSHNLWPFELVMIPGETFFFALTALIGAAIGARSLREKPSVPTGSLD